MKIPGTTFLGAEIEFDYLDVLMIGMLVLTMAFAGIVVAVH